MEKIVNQLQVEVPSKGVVDEGDGVVSFPNGLTITDNSEQRNGTKYDINTLDISKYGGHITGDHVDSLGNLIGEAIGTVKINGKVVVEKIRYAVKENPYARLAYNLLVSGFSKNFSTETIGPPPDADGVYYNAELVGLSQVVTQNNYNATVNQLIHNSLEQSKNDGLDVTGIEDKVINLAEGEKNMEENKTEEKAKVENESEVEVKVEETKTEAPVEKPAEAEKPAETPEEPKQEETPVEEPKEEEAPAEEPSEEPEKEEAEEPKAEKTQKESEEPAPEKEEEVREEKLTEDKKETNNKETEMAKEDKKTVDNSVSKDEIAEIVANALKPLAEEVASVKEAQENAFDASAKEPEFKKEENEAKEENKYASMDWQDRYNTQVNAAWNAIKLNDVHAWETLREINQINLNLLKEKGIARNAMTLEELGNFVISPELYDEIVGHRNNYTAILNATEWKETLSLEFAWLKRTGDIDMKNVSIGVDLGSGSDAPGADDRLKPVSEYSASPQKSSLEELAAVTVVATSATRFAAVDLLSDAAAGYRNDYDRKRAQLVIAKLEQAIDENQQSVAYNPSDDADALTTWLDAITEISDVTLQGTLVFNARTFAELQARALKAGANGPLSEILKTGDIPMVFGHPYIIVPNDLMPTLGVNGDSRSHEVNGVAVPINHAVYFADLTTFTGRTSGGLQYDVSNSAAYESGGNVKSAYQRNELVLRGSFFRGGAVKDGSVVAGIRPDNNANVS